MKRRVFVTGLTGTLGRAAMDSFLSRCDEFQLTVLARNSRKNHRMLDKHVSAGRLGVLYGDLCNYDDVRRGIDGCDVVLHMGGMVSPVADHYPELTMKVNTTAAENIVRAVRELGQADDTVVVNIGSVAQTGMRTPPHHWARTGDPLLPSFGDTYALSKIAAEKIIADSGIRRWASLRLGSILSPGILTKGTDPITFHVPMDGVLEWTSDVDCGRLMTAACAAGIPDEFWCNFYNIGGGRGYCLTYYEFYSAMLRTLGCPPPDKSFDARWFARRNFHGAWFEDSDRLDDFLHFRSGQTCEEWFEHLHKNLPLLMRATPVVPAALIRWAMKFVAASSPLGPLSWFRNGDRERVEAFFGDVADWHDLPRWKDMKFVRPTDNVLRLDHGYDETKPHAELDIEDMRKAAIFRGGRCVSDTMKRGDISTQLEWECHHGHRFMASPRLVLLGGHWCPYCRPSCKGYEADAAVNPFVAQLFTPTL